MATDCRSRKTDGSTAVDVTSPAEIRGGPSINSLLKNECHGSVSRGSVRMSHDIRTADTAVALVPSFFNSLLSVGNGAVVPAFLGRDATDKKDRRYDTC